MTGEVAHSHGRWGRDATNRLTYELPGIPADSYAGICRLVADQFDLRPVGRVDGWDVLLSDYRSHQGLIALEWDNWTEFTVVAKEATAEPLVRSIARFLEHNPVVRTHIIPRST